MKIQKMPNPPCGRSIKTYARGNNDAPSITKYGSPVRLDAQIVALRLQCARTALRAPPMTVCLCQGGIRQLTIQCFICLGNSNRCVHPEVPTGTRTQPSWQAPLRNMHVEASFGHTAPSISITEGRRSRSAVHHQCVPNDVADGKWSLQLLHVLDFRAQVPGCARAKGPGCIS